MALRILLAHLAQGSCQRGPGRYRDPRPVRHPRDSRGDRNPRERTAPMNPSSGAGNQNPLTIARGPRLITCDEGDGLVPSGGVRGQYAGHMGTDAVTAAAPAADADTDALRQAMVDTLRSWGGVQTAAAEAAMRVVP